MRHKLAGWLASLVGTTVFRRKFFQIPLASCQIPWLTAANFPRIVINFYGPLNPKKYAVFVASNCNWEIQLSTKYTWNISDKLRSIVSTFLPLRPNRQSCISWQNHVYIQFGRLKTTKICRNFSPYYWPVPNSAKFHENVEIPQQLANPAARLKILHAAENCGAY